MSSSSSFFELMEERFEQLVQPARDYRSILVNEKIKRAKKRGEIEITTGNKNYNRTSRRKSKVKAKKK